MSDPRSAGAAGIARGLIGAAADRVAGARVLAGAGVVRPMRPDKLPRLGVAYLTRGATIGTGIIAGRIRHPDATMLHDELGSLTFADLDRRTNAIATGLSRLGVDAGDGVAIMARNHRGFVEAVGATSKLGADALFLNTSFSGPQLAAVLEREQPAAVIYDAEFAGLLADAGPVRQRVLAWTDDDGAPDDAPTLERLAAGPSAAPSSPSRQGRMTILTSGTTGTPKGAQRGKLGPDLATGLLSRIPLREGMTTVLPAPLFHAWGLAGFGLSSMLLGSPIVLRRRFDPEAVLGDIERHRAEAMFVVPVMLARILDLPGEVRDRYDISSLKVVAASGSALPGDLAARWMDYAGDNLYNMYGSTEVTFATIATPADMRAAPGTAGKAPRGVVVRLYDDAGGVVERGGTGRIFVGNKSLFEGYTGGGSKDQIDGLMATGDIGRFDEAGRLFVVGRDDEMIVSGGENVFPKEVEDCLLAHAAVGDAAAIGVDDEQFGQRLKAFLVRTEGVADTPGDDELKAHVKDNLAGYKVPREFVWLDELPRNATGKIVKRELAEADAD
ncbi:2-succinylbenzoate--CoA ligase [Paraconexibacter sp. AEG42_29]|uniref:2-succinylbenzoate--CoA ligase n=1 Tax=Paraconexibacter sp. AEG42_29 TaxID=2997339 RepID=A0AAU7B048_9ACTN